MDFGFPIIYFCPSCGKKMKMETYTSYTVSRTEYFSDGNVKESGICCAHFTPELAKCPHCDTLFFRGNARSEETTFITNTSRIKYIQEPGRGDLVNAVKNKITKKWQEEKAIREELWRNFNTETWYGNNVLTGDDLKIWQANCAALLRLTEKNLNEMRSGKNSKNYSDSDRNDCLIILAELNRNLGNFEKCMEIFNELGSNWYWLKKQFAWECKAKNIFTFELMGKNEINLERATDQYGNDYYNRAKKFLPPYYGRRNVKKALADFKKAEDLGMRGIVFYQERGDIYLDECNDPDSAIADFTKALKQKDKGEWLNRYISGILSQRSSAYLKKGNFKKALADIQRAIDEDIDNDSLYIVRSAIYEAMGNKDKNPQGFYQAAEKDRRKAEMIKKQNLELLEKQREEWEALIKKPARTVHKRQKKGEIGEI